MIVREQLPGILQPFWDRLGQNAAGGVLVGSVASCLIKELISATSVDVMPLVIAAFGLQVGVCYITARVLGAGGKSLGVASLMGAIAPLISDQAFADTVYSGSTMGMVAAIATGILLPADGWRI